jgi:hypothetical protein
MLWRLNFLVTVLTMLLNNTYILYYIVPLHTFYFFVVLVYMAVWKQGTYSRYGAQLKLLVLAGVIYCIWEVQGLWAVVWAWFPVSAETDKEWHFRTFLDHYSCLFGMAFAANFPVMINWFKSMDNIASPGKRQAAQFTAISLAAAAIAVWGRYFFTMSKWQYNGTHPYVAVLPILGYILIRNAIPSIRAYYIGE